MGKEVRIHPKTKKSIKAVEGLLFNNKQLYRYTDIGDYSATREVIFRAFDSTLHRNIDDTELMAYLKKAMKCIDAQDLAQAKMVLYTVMELVSNSTPLEAIYNIAALYYFTLDEDVETFDHTVNLQKVEEFKMQPISGFFLPKLLQDLGHFKQKSIEEINLILSQAKSKTETFRQLVLQKPLGSA